MSACDCLGGLIEGRMHAYLALIFLPWVSTAQEEKGMDLARESGLRLSDKNRQTDQIMYVYAHELRSTGRDI
jgi:hypothetical protein